MMQGERLEWSNTLRGGHIRAHEERLWRDLVRSIGEFPRALRIVFAASPLRS